MMLIDPMIYYNKDDNEVWKPLVFENVPRGEYLVSNHGNVYDLTRSEYVSKSISKSNGYVYIHLRGKTGGVLLHRVVAENFVAEKREDQVQVNHMNGKKSCNRDINLEWSSPIENVRHAFETGLAINNIGENSHLSKLSNDTVEEICKLLSEGKRYSEILELIGLENTDNNRDMIGNIYRGIAWGHISCKYTFPEIDQRFRANSRETIELICKYIQDGYSNMEIFRLVYKKEFDRKKDKQTYELIRLIRNKKVFIDISQKYKF